MLIEDHKDNIIHTRFDMEYWKDGVGLLPLIKHLNITKGKSIQDSMLLEWGCFCPCLIGFFFFVHIQIYSWTSLMFSFINNFVLPFEKRKTSGSSSSDGCCEGY